MLFSLVQAVCSLLQSQVFYCHRGNHHGRLLLFIRRVFFLLRCIGPTQPVALVFFQILEVSNSPPLSGYCYLVKQSAGSDSKCLRLRGVEGGSRGWRWKQTSSVFSRHLRRRDCFLRSEELWVCGRIWHRAGCGRRAGEPGECGHHSSQAEKELCGGGAVLEGRPRKRRLKGIAGV